MTMTIITCPKCGAKNRVDERAGALQPVCGRCGEKLEVAGGGESDGHPLTVTDATFGRDVLDVKGKPVLLDCWAPWCGPCRMIAPTIEQLAAESNGQWIIAKLNTDENRQTSSRYSIDAIPTLLIFKDGKLVDRVMGLQSRQALEVRLAAHV